ncbi:MAG TPA: family 16 glycosylhydrolase, partial [Caulobacteraceae bacterium]|nr:family 16 glycosylhydrolase [Caulobacteraceae bacterium]
MSNSKSHGRGRTAYQLAAALSAAATIFALQAQPASAGLPSPGGGAWDFSQKGAALDLTGYQVTFDDEFTTADVACYDWAPVGSHRWYVYNNVTIALGAVHCTPGAVGANVSPDVFVNNHLLVLGAHRRNGVWNTGAVQTFDPHGEGFDQQYGYYEASIKLPAATPAGVNLWPAFILDSGHVYPGTAYEVTELDVLEAWSNAGTAYDGYNQVTLHSWPATPANLSILPTHEQAPFMTAVKAFDGNWHTYGVRFTPTYWTIYIDRKEVGRYPVNQALMNKPMWMQLNLGISPTTLPSTANADYWMYVNAVHVYACMTSACQ